MSLFRVTYEQNGVTRVHVVRAHGPKSAEAHIAIREGVTAVTGVEPWSECDHVAESDR